MLHRTSDLDGFFGTARNRHKIWHMGTWNVRSLSRTDSMTTLARELAKHAFDSIGVYVVRWDRGWTEPAGDYAFFYGHNGNREFETGFFVGVPGVILLFWMCMPRLRIELTTQRTARMKNFTTSKNLIVKRAMFSDSKIHKLAYKSPERRRPIRLMTFWYRWAGIQVY
jgi:hypothetical protein